MEVYFVEENRSVKINSRIEFSTFIFKLFIDCKINNKSKLIQFDNNYCNVNGDDIVYNGKYFLSCENLSDVLDVKDLYYFNTNKNVYNKKYLLFAYHSRDEYGGMDDCVICTDDLNLIKEMIRLCYLENFMYITIQILDNMESVLFKDSNENEYNDYLLLDKDEDVNELLNRIPEKFRFEK